MQSAERFDAVLDLDQTNNQNLNNATITVANAGNNDTFTAIVGHLHLRNFGTVFTGGNYVSI